jgi:hypothetical protein
MKQTLSRRSVIAYLAVSMLATACGGTQASTNTTSGPKGPGGAAPGGPPPGGASSASNLKLVGTYTLSGGTASLMQQDIYCLSQRHLRNSCEQIRQSDIDKCAGQYYR